MANAEAIICGDLLAAHLHEPMTTSERARRGFWAVAGMFFVMQIGGSLPISLWVLWQEKFDFGTGTLTLVFAVYTLGTFLSLILLVPLSDQLGRRPALMASIGLAVLSSALYLVADGVQMLFVARFVSGLAVGITTASGAAALRELEPGSRARRASLVTTAVTMGGLGTGPLLAGVLAEYAAEPLRLVFWLYLGLLGVAFLAVVFASETVQRAARISWRPGRLALPARARGEFLLACAAGFCAFTLLGLFSSVVPSFLETGLHERNHAVAGAIVCTIFYVATATQLLLFRLTPNQALAAGLPLLLVGLALIELGLWNGSLPVFIAGTVTGGAAVGLTFMGSLAVVNRVAEPERRAQILAAYFVANYAGIALPSIAVGEAVASLGADDATLYCAIAVAVLALTVLSVIRRGGQPLPIG
jgi:MFS family permease